MGFPTGSPIGLYCTSTVSLPLRCFFSFSEGIVTIIFYCGIFPTGCSLWLYCVTILKIWFFYRVFHKTLYYYCFRNAIFLQGVLAKFSKFGYYRSCLLSLLELPSGHGLYYTTILEMWSSYRVSHKTLQYYYYRSAIFLWILLSLGAFFGFILWGDP